MENIIEKIDNLIQERKEVQSFMEDIIEGRFIFETESRLHLVNPDLEKELENMIYNRLEKRLEEINSGLRSNMLEGIKNF